MRPLFKGEKMLEDLRVREFTEKESRMLNPLQLALIGDGVYEVYIRTLIVSSNPEISANKLHREAIKYVKAKAQADIMHVLEEELNEDERYIYKRGRNAKSATMPKNAEVRDYRMATGFEALVGYLYLSGKKDRLEFVLERSAEIIKSL